MKTNGKGCLSVRTICQSGIELHLACLASGGPGD